MLTADFTEFLEHAETLIIGNQSPLFRGLLKKVNSARPIVDLVHLLDRRKARPLAKRAAAAIGAQA